jgi:glycosyltransferase involved in cell wall biosynthesis
MRGISIIIPTYNRENFIAEAIGSVLIQDYDGDIEIVISDDGSTDKTLEIAESFGERVVVLRKPVNCVTQGAASTRNRGIRASTKPYICFLDSDDYFLPGHLKKISSSLEADERFGFAFCRILEVKDNGDSRFFRAWTKDHLTRKNILYPVISANNIVCTNVFLFHRYVFNNVGLFNENYINGEDGDMWMRISEQYKGVFVDNFGAVRRKHEFYQLTGISKRIIFRRYSGVFNDAIKRYYKLDLNDPYRIYRLRILALKYRLFSMKLLFNTSRLYSNFRINKVSNSDWFELSYFI